MNMRQAKIKAFSKSFLRDSIQIISVLLLVIAQDKAVDL
jgi:hypothetical protein